MPAVAIEDIREELRTFNAEAVSKTVEELSRQLRLLIREEFEAFLLKLTEDNPAAARNTAILAANSNLTLRDIARNFDEDDSETSSGQAHSYDEVPTVNSLAGERDTVGDDEEDNPSTLRSGRWMSAILRRAKSVVRKDVPKTVKTENSFGPCETFVKYEHSQTIGGNGVASRPAPARSSRKTQSLEAFKFEEFMLQHRRDYEAVSLMTANPMDGEWLPPDLKKATEVVDIPSTIRMPSIRSMVSPQRSQTSVVNASPVRKMGSTRHTGQGQPLLMRPPPLAPLHGTLVSSHLSGTPTASTIRTSKAKEPTKSLETSEMFEIERAISKDSTDSNYEVMPSDDQDDRDRPDEDTEIILPGSADTPCHDSREDDLLTRQSSKSVDSIAAEDLAQTWTAPKGNAAQLYKNGRPSLTLKEMQYGNSSLLTHPHIKKMQRKGTLTPSTIRRARCISCAYKTILHPWFDIIISLFVVANTITGGVAVDYKARNLKDPVPVVLRVCELMFCTVFVIEIMLRILVTGRRFFTMHGWQWNWFDLLVVAFQVVDELILAVIDDQRSGSRQDSSKSSSLRVLRVIRMVRVLRFARILRLIQELHTLVSAIVGSMKSFLWTVFLLFMMNYLFAVFITDMVADHRQTLLADNRPDVNDEMKFYWGNLGYSILSLYESVSGGVDWDSCLRPLMGDIHPIGMAMVFSFYISFSMLVILNLVTGLFVSSAKSTIEENKHFHLVTQLREMFMSSDLDGSGTITWEEFETQLDNPLMEELFKVIQMDLSEARGFFSLLDLDGTGKVNAEQFVMGCLRLRGTAKAIDMTTLMAQTKQSMTWQVNALCKMDRKLRHIEHALGKSRSGSRVDRRHFSRNMSKIAREQTAESHGLTPSDTAPSVSLAAP